jgi:ubiquinone/menaquinone biosynthesis C-methylase UbiE
VSFDAVAPWYRTLETIAFGNALQRARTACLDAIGSPRRALIVGEGNGRFLSELLRAHRDIEVDCVDASERMLSLAQKRVGPDAERVRFLQEDITSWTPPAGQYDLIVTHFFLDCFRADQLAEIVRRLSQAATASAIWLLADFCVPSGGFDRLRARAWLSAMYRFFRYVAGIQARELVDPSPFLRRQNFVLAQEHLLRHGILKSQLWRRQL